MIIKRPKVQLPGRVKPISVPTQKPHDEEDEGPSHDPTASSSNDNTIPLPTTTPTSFMPGDFAQPAQQQSSQGTPELVSSQNDHDETEPYETDDTPVLTEEDIAQLQEEDADTEPCTSDHSHFVNVDVSLEEEAEVLVSVFLPSERTYLATTPQLTPEIVEELLEENQLARAVFTLMTCSLLEPRSFWRGSRKLSSHNSRLVMKM